MTPKNPNFPKFSVAFVVSGIVQAENPAAVRVRLEEATGVFDFVDSRSVTMQITERDRAAEIAELLKTEKIDDRFFVVCIDKKYLCPAGDRHLKGELSMDSGGCPYIGTFSCPFIAPALLEFNFHKNLPRCPFDDHD